MSEQFDLFQEPEENAVEAAPPKESRVLYFDLETQKSADDVGGWGNIHLMKLAVGVVWDSVDKRHHVYLEDEAAKLVDKLKNSDLVVGFNVVGFDYTVLQPDASLASVDLQDIKTFDMLLDIKKKLGFRLSLDHLAGHTLGVGKSADGLMSLQWYKEGKIDQIVEYCKQDVDVTRDLFLFGQENGFVRYETRGGKIVELPVDWKVENLIASGG